MPNFPTTIRVPVDDDYVAQVGKAVYLFAYYEWTIICIINQIMPGFVHEYCRGKNPLTSSMVLRKFKQSMSKFPKDAEQPTSGELEMYSCRFKTLIDKRNALLHAHPAMYNDNQILSYQTHPTRPLPDFNWEEKKIQNFIKEIDDAAVDVGKYLEKIRKLNL